MWSLFGTSRRFAVSTDVATVELDKTRMKVGVQKATFDASQRPSSSKTSGFEVVET